MVVALIALGVALGGTSVAATTGLVTGTQQVQTPPRSAALLRLQRRVTALERESGATAGELNRICGFGKLVVDASVDVDGNLSVQHVFC